MAFARFLGFGRYPGEAAGDAIGIEEIETTSIEVLWVIITGRE